MFVVLLTIVSCYLPPVTAPVSAPFDRPDCAYCPGHRGLDYDVHPGTDVHAIAGGIVTFAGVVAGIRYVTVHHDDDLLATYGRLRSSPLVAGVRVEAGQVVGRSTDELYLGLRRGDEYIDPAPLIGRPAHRPRLVPTDGGRPRPAADAAQACAAASSGTGSAVMSDHRSGERSAPGRR